MPQIRDYSQRTSVLGPIETRRLTGDDFGASGARDLAQAGQAMQSVSDVIHRQNEIEETNDAAVKIAKVQAEKTNELQELVRSGQLNAEEFSNKLDEQMGQMSGDYTTSGAKAYFTRASAQLKSHFTTATVSAAAELAGVKAVSGLQEELNARSSTLMKSPSAFSDTHQMMTESIDAKVQAGTLDFATAEKLKLHASGELAQGAIRGWAEIDPEEAQKQLKSGVWDKFLGTDQKKQILGEAQTAIHAREVEKIRIQEANRKAKIESDRVLQDQMLTKIYKGSLSTKDILGSNLDFEHKKEMLALLKARVDDRSNGKTQQGLFAELFARVQGIGDKPPILDERELYDYVKKGVLGFEDMTKLRKELQNKGSAEGEYESRMKAGLFKAAESQISKANPMIGKKDPDGEIAMSAFTQYFYDEYESGRKSGKSIKQLLDPASPDYIGKEIPRFKKSAQEIMKANINLLKPSDPTKQNPNAWQKGESYDQWKKRTSGK